MSRRAWMVAALSGLTVSAGFDAPPRARRPEMSSIHVAEGAKDSARIRREVMLELRQFLRQYRRFMSQQTAARAEFSCEKTVSPYCYGPLNGKLPFGWKFGALPVARPMADSVVPKDLLKRTQPFLTRALKKLDDAQKQLPGDRWILGQRVYQRVGANHVEEARTVAQGCHTEPWWCAALVGYTTTLLNENVRADSAFDVMLAAMPDTLRCAWEDVGDLVYEDPDKHWYESLSCAERHSAHAVLWWLSDPLYLISGNERRTEHFQRLVYARLFDDAIEALPPVERHEMWPIAPVITAPPPVRLRAINPIGGLAFWDRDLWRAGSLLPILRAVGTPAYIIIEHIDPPAPPSPPEPIQTVLAKTQFLLQYPQPTFHFLPALSAVQAPLRATNASWSPLDPLALERFHPPFGAFGPLDAQVAFFRRGTASRVIAAADVGASTVVGRDRALVATAVALTRSPTDPPRVIRNALPGSNVIFDVAAPSDSTIVSLEALSPGSGAARSRFATGPPPMPNQRVTASDLLLLANANALPTTLDSAGPRAALHSNITRGSSVGVYWELYGLAPGDTVSFALSALETSTSTLTRIGRLLGVARDALSSNVSWLEPIRSAEAIEGRSIAIDLSVLAAGHYRLQVTMTVAGQQPVTVRREFDVVNR